VTNTAGGEVMLASASASSWATPTLTGTYNRTGNEDIADVFISGNHAYLTTTSTTSNFVVVDISNPASPAQVGVLTLAGNLNAVHVVGSYAYVASTDNNKELIVVNVTNPAAPTEAGSLNMTGNSDANAVYVNGTTAYVGRTLGTGTTREFHVVNVTTPTLPVNLGTLDLSSSVAKIAVAGNYAYLTTNSNTQELIIVNVTVPAAPTNAGSVDLSGTGDGQGLVISGSTLYVTTLNNAASGELFILNLSNPTSPSLVSSFEIGASALDVYVNGTQAFLATEVTNKEFMVIDVSTLVTPVELSSLDLTGNGNAIQVVGSYAYETSDANAAELVIISGGSGSSGYQTSGIFQSQTFDAGVGVGFNYLTFTATKPSGTNIILEVATNTDNATWNYAGSYTTAGEIPLASASGRYLRYRATLTGDGTVTPQLNDVTVNYSP
jgi:hypothetical protein